jgi:hypothetical protein
MMGAQLQLALNGGELILDATLSIEDSAEGRRYGIVQSNGIAFDHARILATAVDQLTVEESPGG